MIKMLGSRVLIEEVIEDIKSESGIILGETKTSANRVGTVISVGDSVQEIGLGVKVMFDSYKSFPIELNGEPYLILDIESVIGVYL